MKLILSIVFLWCISLSSWAVIFIEPQVGHTSGTFHADIDSPGFMPINVTATGTSMGAKAGVELGVLQLGVDYLYSALKSSGSYDYLNEWAGLLGLRFGWFRIYGGYIFSAKDLDTSGTGYKFGISFYPFSWVAINGEVRKVTYKTFQIQGIDVNSDYEAAMVSLSFPIEFL